VRRGRKGGFREPGEVSGISGRLIPGRPGAASRRGSFPSRTASANLAEPVNLVFPVLVQAGGLFHRIRGRRGPAIRRNGLILCFYTSAV
jgi:hypothetical protein